MLFFSRLLFLGLIQVMLLQSVTAIPLQPRVERRQARKSCKDKNDPPCICNDQFGFRKINLQCPGTTFTFVDPRSPTDGTLKKLTSNLGVPDIQCDHIVELQVVASQITPEMCTRFEKSPKDFSSFFDVINSGKNLVDIPIKVNGAKGILFGGKEFGTQTTKKDANGLNSYFSLIAADAEASAIKINEEMERIMGKGKGFTNFVDDFMKKLKVDFPNKIQRSLPQLSPAGIPPAPGSNGGAIFVDATDATIARCKAGKRSSVWLAARDLFVRQVTGKKPLPKDCKQAATNKSTAKASTKEIAKPSNPKPGAKVPPARTETKASPKLPAKPAAKPPAKKPVAKAPGKKAVSKKTRRDD